MPFLLFQLRLLLLVIDSFPVHLTHLLFARVFVCRIRLTTAAPSTMAFPLRCLCRVSACFAAAIGFLVGFLNLTMSHIMSDTCSTASTVFLVSRALHLASRFEFGGCRHRGPSLELREFRYPNRNLRSLPNTTL